MTIRFVYDKFVPVMNFMGTAEIILYPAIVYDCLFVSVTLLLVGMSFQNEMNLPF